MARRARKSRADLQRWEQLIAALRLMNFAFNNVKLYPPTHSEVAGVVAKLHETLKPIIDEQGDVGIGFMDEMLYIEGAMSIEETANNQMLVDRFNRCRVKYVIFMQGLSIQDLTQFFVLLNGEAVKPSSEPPGPLLEKAGVTTIHLVEAEVDDAASKTKAGKKKTILDWYARAVKTLGEAQERLRDKHETDLQELFRVVDDLMATVRSKGFEPFLMLPRLAAGADPHLAHAVNVAIYCCTLGDLCRLNSGQVNLLCAMALLHDLGRLTIPVEWTSDHARLSPDELRIAAQHADWGFLLLLRQEQLPPQVAVAAVRHHDRPAGAALPDVFLKILALADAYDLALVGPRYYWKKARADRALARLLNSRGVGHEPVLVKLLAGCVGLYPVGSFVRLADGRPGMVVRPHAANALRPRVWLYEERQAPPPPPAEGAAAPEWDPEAPVVADMMELAPGGLGFKLEIARVVDPPAGLDVAALLDRNKEYLVSYGL